jgi:hypothetical protein
MWWIGFMWLRIWASEGCCEVVVIQIVVIFVDVDFNV